jgi:archaellum component FlaC
MPAGNSGNSTFANVADLPNGHVAAHALTKLCKQLRNTGADTTAERFEGIDDKIAGGNNRFEDLEKHIAPDRAIDELNSARGRPRWRKLRHGDWRGGLRPLLGFAKSVRFAHLLRNVAALAPLIFTWILLGKAAQQYNSDLNHHPGTVNKPFLLLWQQGFGTGFPSFERVTIIDFALLALVVVLTFWVHWAEGQADRAADSVYEVMDTLQASLADRRALPTPITPLSPEEWAEITSETLTRTIAQTEALNSASERAIKEASDRLSSIQDTSQSLIQDFKGAVLETLTSVTQQNEHFIENTRKTNQEVLQVLVEQQMQPLLDQVQDLLNQFRTEQAAYTSAVTGLTKSAQAIETSAEVLATSAQAFDGSTHSIAKSLDAMASSQERFASNIEDSAESMSTASAAMVDAKDTLRADLHVHLKEMAGNITRASTSLEQAQAGLASTTGTMHEAAGEFAKTAAGVAKELREPMALLQQALTHARVVGQRRGRWFFGRQP